MEVGEAYVSIRAKDGGLRRDIKRETTKAAAGQDVEVKVKADTRKARKDIRNLDRDIRNLQQVAKGLQFPALATGAFAAAGGLQAAAGGAVALTAGLTPVVGLAGALPGLLGSVGQAAGVAKLAFSGMGDALKAQTKSLDGTKESAQDYREELQKLPKDARNFVRLLGTLRPRLEELRKTAAGGFLPGAAGGLRDALRLFPRVEQAVGETAKTLGGLAERFGEFLGSAGFGRDFAAITRSNTKVLNSFGLASLDVVKAITGITVEARPLTEWLGRLARGWAANLRGTVASARETGALARFFREARTASENLLGTLGNVAGALFEVGRAAFPLGKDLLRALRDATGELRAFLGSTEGQQEMRAFFDDIRASLPGVLSLVKDIATSFADIARVTAGASRALIGFLDRHPALREFVAQMIALSLAVKLMGIAKLVAGFTAFIKLMGGVGLVRGMTGAMFGLAGGTAAVGTAASTTAFQLGFLTGKAGQLLAQIAKLGLATGAGAAGIGLLAGGSSDVRPRGASGLKPDEERLFRDLQAKRARGEALSAKTDKGSFFSEPKSGQIESEVQAFDRLSKKVSEHQRVQNATASAVRGTTGALAAQKIQVEALTESTLNALDSNANYRQSQLNLKQAQERVNQLIREGKKGTDEYKQAQIDVTVAESNLVRSREAQRRALAEQTKAILAAKNATAGQVEAIIALHKRAGVKPPRALLDYLDQVRAGIGRVNSKNITLFANAIIKKGATLGSPSAIARPGRLVGFATGGPVLGPGTPTSDSIPARLSNNEHVITAQEVKGAGGHGALEQIRSLWRRSPGFAQGGPVAASGGLLNVGFRHGNISQFMSGIDQFIASAGKLTAQLAQQSQGGFIGGASLAGGMSFARSQTGKPYIWGGVGPAGYDCSGFMSAITNVILGQSPHRRRFATGSFPTSGWARGFTPAGFNIGSRRGSPGHMAGTLGNVNVESRGSAGVVVGANARGAKHPLFGGNIWHLVKGGGRNPGSQERMLNTVAGERRFDRGRAFANGGLLPPEPFIGVGQRTGQLITLNENGQERVIPAGQSGSGSTYVLNLQSLTMSPQDAMRVLEQMEHLHG